MMLVAYQGRCPTCGHDSSRATEEYRKWFESRVHLEDGCEIGVGRLAAPDATSPASQVDQIDAWGRALYEANAFYTESSDWSEMAAPDGGIKDLHLDMARAAKAVWDTCDDAPIPAVQSGAVATELTEFQRIVSEQDLAEPYWQGYRDALNLVASQGLAAPQSEPLPGGVGELDDIQVHHIVRRACEAAGSIAAWARANNLSDEQVRLFLRGKRPPEPKLLKVLGLVRRVTYQEDGSGQKIAALSGKEPG